MPGRGAELPLKHQGTLLLLALLAIGAPLRGQEGVEEAAVEAGIRITSLVDDGVWMPGGLAEVSVGDGLRVGGSGWVTTRAVAVAANRPDLEMRMGYGGAVLSMDLRRVGGTAFGGRILVGAGNADVRDRATGALFASDNFGVLEPEVFVRIPLFATLSFVGGLTYRATFGVDDLEGVESRHISAPSLRVALRLGAS